MNHLVYVDTTFINDNLLKRAIFVNEIGKSWVIQSENCKTGNIDEYKQIEKEKALKMFPKLDELFALQLYTDAFFIKGKNSEKWCDFH